MARRFSLPWTRAAGVVVWLACASGVLGDTPLLAPVAGAVADAPPPAPWAVVLLPNQTKPQSRFVSAVVDGHAVLRISADNSYATLVHPLPHGSRATRSRGGGAWTSRCRRRTCGRSPATTRR